MSLFIVEYDMMVRCLPSSSEWAQEARRRAWVSKIIEPSLLQSRTCCKKASTEIYST
jgi:hypothetical protein